MRVFVTGGSGFLGGAVIRRLLEEHTVLGMARSDSAAEAVSRLGATPVRCSLQDVEAAHLEGCDAVVHCAAYVAEWGPPDAYRSANVDGTARALAAAGEAGIGRFVHMSTESVLFTGDHLSGMDESWPYPESTPFPYSSTKQEAEQLALAANGGGMEVVVLRPILVWGEGDRTILPELVAMTGEGQFAWLDGGRHGITPTHVDNVAHAVSLALERGRGGEVYFITDGERFELRDFLSRYVATAGVELPARSLPGWLARGGASLVEGIWKLMRPGRKPPLTRFGTSLLSREITASSDKAINHLGYHPVISVDEGLRRLARAATPAE